MLVNVKCYQIPQTAGHHMVSFMHPLSERPVRKRFFSKEEAFRYKEETEKKFRRDDHTMMQGLKVSDYIQLYLVKSDKPYFQRMRKVFKDFCETFGEFLIHEVTPEVMDVWLKQLREEGSYADATIFKIKVTVNSFFLFLIREGIIRESPIQEIKFDTYQLPEKRKRNLLRQEDLGEILQESKRLNPEFLYPFLLALTETAGRVTELEALKWKDVDLNAGYFHFKAKPRAGARAVKISSHLCQTLEKKKKVSEYVFTCPYHEPLGKNKLTRMVKAFKAESTFKKPWCPWDFRYSYAYHFLQGGGTIEALQKVMGHCRPTQTKRRYEHFLPKAENVPAF